MATVEQRYVATAELTDGGKRVTWDDIGCYATSPEHAAKKTLATFTKSAKAIIRAIHNEAGVPVLYTPRDGE